MKTIIQQVQKSILDEIKKGNIQIVDCTHNLISFTVFDEYNFQIHVLSDYKKANIFESDVNKTFMNLPKLSENEQAELFTTIYNIHKSHVETFALKTKRDELDKLTNEVNLLSNL